jgi:transcriptional regulator with GAF, ATPase, and Fis domain
MASCQPLSPPPEPLAGDSPALREARRRLHLVAPAETTVLLVGETGTGKGVAAAELHARSRRAAGAFVHVDCAALAPGLLESELFGHERGAFTGALAARTGRLELARGGTLFLDEVGELDLPLQGKLLRALHDRRFERVGGVRTLELEARVVAATNRDLAADVAAGRFRRDLYFRLAVFEVALPPLRERLEDLPTLVAALLPDAARRAGLRAPSLRPDFLAALAEHQWPGNVRELANALERALLLAAGGALDGALARACLGDDGGSTPSCEPRREQVAGVGLLRGPEGGPGAAGSELIARVLRDTGGNVSRAARRLGLPRSTLRWQIERCGLQALLPRD